MSTTFDAQDIARDAALADAEFASQVGVFVSVEYADENRVASYLFEADLPGYKGWRWCVTVVKVDSDSAPTVCDVVVLPGPDSLLAPEWIEYRDRIQPEDIAPGIIVPSALDDTRLVKCEIKNVSSTEIKCRLNDKFRVLGKKNLKIRNEYKGLF